MRHPFLILVVAAVALAAGFAAVPAVVAGPPVPAGTIVTVAGTDKPGFSGDGGPAAQAQVNSPHGVAFDAAGNLFIAEMGGHRVRKVDLAGNASTVAGTGQAGYSGDGSPATAARLNGPNFVTFDGSGNLFITDTFNYRVRKVSPDGIIATAAGTGKPGSSVDGGPADQTRLQLTDGVATDAAGNLYFTSGDNRVRKVSPDGIISTVAGTGIAGFAGDGGPATAARLSIPAGLAVDASGSLYIGEFSGHRVRKVTPDGIITTVAGTGKAGYSGDGGPATAAQLNTPFGLAVDSAGNLFIAEPGSGRVRKVDPQGIITTVAGNGSRHYAGEGGPATAAGFVGPASVAVDPEGNLIITDLRVLKVYGVAATGLVAGRSFARQPGTIHTVAGSGQLGYSGDGGAAPQAQLNVPLGVAVGPAGELYIGDCVNHRVRKVSPDGTITTVAGTGKPGFSGDGGPATQAMLNLPAGVALDRDGNLYIGDTFNNRIRRVDPAGTITTVAGTGQEGFAGDGGPAAKAVLNKPEFPALDAAGNLFFNDLLNNRVRKVGVDGTITTVAGGGQPTDRLGDGGLAAAARLSVPYGVAVDAEANLYIADFANDRVRKVTPDGIIRTVAGGGQPADGLGDGGPGTGARLRGPTGLAIDAGGALFIADNRDGRVRKLNPDGTLTTVAGTGGPVFSGEGGPAAAASLSGPIGLAVDPQGNLLVVDTGRAAPSGVGFDTLPGNRVLIIGGAAGPH